MSRAGEIALDFGGDERTFRLGIGQWRKVQEACDAGPPELLARLSTPFVAAEQGLKFEQMAAAGLLGRWRLEDVRQPILQGLLGGGMPGPEALKLVKDWVDERPLIESVRTAYRVIMASIIGVEDEDAVGEPLAAGEADPNFRAASSDSESMASTPSAAP